MYKQYMTSTISMCLYLLAQLHLLRYSDELLRQNLPRGA